MFGKLKNVCTKNQYMFHRNGTFSYLKKIHFSYLKMTYFSFLKMPDFRIWNGHFFVFATDTFLLFEIGTIFVFVIDTFFGFEIATFFGFENGTFPISKLHISFLTIKRLCDKVTWGMPTFEMSSSEGKQAKTNSKSLKCSFQSFKVSKFQICGDKVTWGISTFEMLAFKTPSVECKDKQRKFEVKVSIWLYEVSYVTIY